MPSKKNPVDLELVIEDEEANSGIDTILDDGVKPLEEIQEEAIEAIPTAAPIKPGATIGVQEEVDNISDLILDVDEELDFPTWLIYGKNGTGKTTLLSTMEGVLILAPDEGTLSIRDRAKGKAKKVKIDTWGKVEAVYWWLKNGKQLRDKKGKPCGVEIKTKNGNFKVKAVAWDTVTSVARVCMRNVVLGARENDINKDILKKTLKDWGDMSEKLKYWLYQFKQLRDVGIMNIWVLQETSNAEELDNEEYSIYPAVNTSVRIYILEEADLIFRTFIGKGKNGEPTFKISGKPNPLYVTKDRTGKLSGIISNPSLEAMYKHAFN